MAFTPSTLSVIVQPIGGEGMRFLSYRTDDDQATVTGTDYFAGAAEYGVRVDDLIFVSPVSADFDPYILVVETVDDEGNATAIIAEDEMLKSIYDPQKIEGDAFARANHTGTQAISTVSGLQSALDARQSFQRVRVVDTGGGDPATDYENGDTIDGITLATSDKVLRATDGGDASDGVYEVVASGVASRSSLFDTYDAHPGTMFVVMEGTTNADSWWQCTSDKGGTLDSTAIVIVKRTGTAGLAVLAAEKPEDARNKLAAFDTVADLLADTTLAYSDGSPTVATGDKVVADGYRYEVAASGAADHHLTTAGGVKLYVSLANILIVPEVFGALGDDDDDTTALQSWIAFGKEKNCVLATGIDKTYVTTESLWFGTDDTTGAVKALFGLRSTIKGKCANKPVVDLSGIRNDGMFRMDGTWIEGDATDVPSFGILMGRPKQSSGVVSSGNARLIQNRVSGSLTHAAYYNVQSESNTLMDNYFFNATGFPGVIGRHDYFKDTFWLPFDNETGAFTPGLTITGASSLATAIIISRVDDFGSNDGRMLVQVQSGTFVDDETITDTSTGSATTNIPNGYTTFSTSSPNTALGLEEGSTASHQVLIQNFFNNQSSTSLAPCLLVMDWGSMNLTSCNFNANSGDSDLVHLMRDRTVNAGASQTLQLVNLTANYFHSTHRNSIALGDPMNTGGTIKMVKSWGNHHIGAPTRDIGVISAGSLLMISCELELERKIDLTGASFLDNGVIRFGDNVTTELTADGVLEGNIYANTDTTLNITSSAAVMRAVIHFAGTGLSRNPPRTELVVSSGAITVNRVMHLIDTESNAATDDLDTINVENSKDVNGQVIYLRCVVGTRVTTLKVSGGNIRGQNDVALDDTGKWVALIHDGVAGHWIILGAHAAPP